MAVISGLWCICCSESFLKLCSAMNRDMGKYANDVALMGAVALGRQDALNEVLDIYMPIVSRTSYRILCDRDDSEDITRKVFLRVWMKASDYDGRCDLSIWIYRITCNLCHGCLRRRSMLSFFWITPSLYETSAPLPISPEAISPKDGMMKSVEPSSCWTDVGITLPVSIGEVIWLMNHHSFCCVPSTVGWG